MLSMPLIADASNFISCHPKKRMHPNARKLAGALLLLGSLQFLICMSVAETLYPNYSRAENYISDLGMGGTALLFNVSIVLAGIAALIAAYFLFRASGKLLLPILLALCGIGAMGVGIFPENAGSMHTTSAFVAFFFGALAALASAKSAPAPISYFFALLGIVSLAALALFLSHNTFSLGAGGMERAIVYPFLIWGLLFGALLLKAKQAGSFLA